MQRALRSSARFQSSRAWQATELIHRSSFEFRPRPADVSVVRPNKLDAHHRYEGGQVVHRRDLHRRKEGGKTNGCEDVRIFQAIVKFIELILYIVIRRHLHNNRGRNNLRSFIISLHDTVSVGYRRITRRQTNIASNSVIT